TTITRTAQKGSIVQIVGIVSFVADPAITVPDIAADDVLITGRPSIPPVTDFVLPETRLFGNGAAAWSFNPIAVGLQTATACAQYAFLDSKVRIQISENKDGKTTSI